MPRYLVVANLTLGGDHLLDVLRDRVGRGDARIHLLVPATPPVEGWHTHDHHSDLEAATDRLETCRDRFEQLGADEVTSQVGTARVVDDIGDALRDAGDDPFDEIILSTLPAGPSRWIAMDLPTRVARAHPVPVTHVEAPQH